MHRRASQRSNSQSDLSNNMDEDCRQQISFDTSNTGTFRQTADTSGKSKYQRKPKGCKCRGNCRKKRCGCNSLNQKCTISCKCTDACENRQTPSPLINNESDEEKIENGIKKATDVSIDSSDAENQFKSPKPKNNTTTKSEDETFIATKANASTYLTPKMAR